MKDLNTWTGTGRLTRDSELRQAGASQILGFSIAVNRSVKKDDQWSEEASFFDCTLWGKLAEIMAPKLTKGTTLALTGELRQDRWEKDGQKHSKVVIVVSDLRLMGGPSSASQPQGDSQAPERAGSDDEIPF